MNQNGRSPQAPDLRALLEARRAALLPCREATLASLNAIEGGLAEIALLLQQVDEVEACAALIPDEEGPMEKKARLRLATLDAAVVETYPPVGTLVIQDD